MSTPTLRLRRGDLVHALAAVLPHLSEDFADLAIQGRLVLESMGGQLYLVASDRHTAIIYRLEAIEPVSDAAASVHPRDAKEWLRQARRPGANLVELGQVLVHTALGTPDHRWSCQVALDCWSWRTTLLPHVTAPMTQIAAEGRPACRDTTLLARWKIAATHRPVEPLRIWSTGPRTPLIVAIGERCIGLQMPMDDRDGYTIEQIQSQWALLAPAATRGTGN